MSLGSDVAEWITEVHRALLPGAVERSGAWWGPVRVRHRTRRPDWFGGFDAAWAAPIAAVDAPADAAQVDVATGSFADLPAGIQPPPIRRGDLGPRGEVLGLASTGVRLTWNESGGEVFCWDPGTGRAVLLRGSPPSEYDTVSPMRWLVHWSVVSSGGVLIHAGSVGRRGPSGSRGSLVLGEAGYGKSTTTLACLESGWVTCGDDAVAVFPDDRGWSARPVYAAVKTKLQPSDVVQSDVDPGGSPATVTWEIDGAKRVHLLTSTPSQLVAQRIDLDALIVLDPSSADEPWATIDGAAARNLAAPSTVLPLPFDRHSVLERIGDLARQVPAYRLPRRASLSRTVADVAAITEHAQPGISVVVPVFNGERYIAEALASIIGQTLGRFQIIVVDDGTSDDSLAVAERMRGEIEGAGHSLDIVRHGQNRGISRARNTGIGHSRHRLITFLDQDDTWPAERTAVLLAALRRDDALAARGRMAMHDVMPQVRRPWVRPEWFRGTHPGAVLGATLCRAEVFERIGLLDESMSTGYDDVDWFSRLRDSSVRVAESSSVVVDRKVHDRNQSRRQAADQTDIFASVRAHLARQRGGGGPARSVSP